MISAEERQERLEAVEDTIGTQRADGIVMDKTTLELMQRYVEGEFDLDKFSAAMREYANSCVNRVKDVNSQ